MKPTFTLFHADHGISEKQLAFIQDMVAGPQTSDGFFAQTVVDLDPGDPFPAGEIRTSVNVTVRAVGSII